MLLFNNICCYAQNIDSDKCLSNIVKIDNDMQENRINIQDVDNFMDCFVGFDDNTEILEYRNEILFKLMECFPSDFLFSISQQDATVRKKICLDIEKPIHDSINLYKVYYRISIAHENANIRLQILNSIQIAIENAEKSRILLNTNDPQSIDMS